ncbi:PAS domain S-box protein [candidate division WOR-3 bacterium]|nr:PAS domain S-box protein [candidate division WOR-3 bacterium]
MNEKTLNLLILEDNPDDAVLMVKELERKGFFIKWNRVETEKAFKKALVEEPDLILADYSLPSFDGMTALIIQQKLVPDIPVIIVTGTIGEDVAVECMKSGATDYVMKDRLSRLGPVVKRALEEAEAYRGRKQAEETLKESEEKFRSISETAQDAIIMIDNEGKTSYWNKAAEEIFGYTKKEVIGKATQKFVVPGRYKKNFQRGFRKFREVGEGPIIMKTIELMGIRKDGTEFPVEFSLSPVKLKGKWNAVAILRDITERKKAEEQIQKDLKEKDVMLQEIHHRVKNNLQIISSLLNLQSRYIKDEQSLELFRDSQNRVRSMALIHERLYRSRDLARIPFAEYIRKLTSGLYSVYGVDPGRVVLKIETDDVFLGIDQAIPCGLIINELVSNSLKHAFPETWQGKAEIKVALHQIKSEKVELIVSDNGVGIPEELDFRKTESLGLNLVTLLAEEQLQGKVRLDRKEGTRFQIRFMRGE